MHEPLALSPRHPAETAVALHASRFRRVPLRLMRSDRQPRGFVGGERGLQQCLDHGPVLPVRGTEDQIVDLNEKERFGFEQRGAVDEAASFR